MASLSKRVPTARHSFSHPTHCSTTARRRYASRSNRRRPSSGLWSFRRGMTSLIPWRLSQRRIRGELYPLSPATLTARHRGRPRRLGMRTLSMTRSNCGLSCLCPAVTSTARGRPLPSVTRCSLVPKPPRLLPRAWSAGSEGGGFFFRRPGRGPRRPDVGAVDAEQLGVDEPGLVELQLERLDDAVEQAALAQRGEPVVDGLPRPEPLGQVTPGGPGVEPPEDAVEHQPVVLPLPAGLGRTRREELGQQRPLVVGQF